MSLALQPRLFGSPQTEKTSDDYYTPAWIFDRLGLTFDMDVASPPEPLPWIPATRALTVADDGLATPWEGRVWMNPPYSNVTPWVARFLAHGCGVALLPFAKSAWFDRLWVDRDVAICAPGIEASKFVGGPISLPVFLVAIGEECREALGRVGVVR